ncbi:DNA damage-regulated autophagy modulator protein 1-like isoform X1 [Pecten maximus]|uniref:DNA damage-regulated autophagy modulator protein 1-like isoform X1 n=1 Tax=Pecten maximus TaxID=6579 RepID=UPI001458DD96|nr:DNA damage-regulated autophagy modulator protein 1-like isoform X1 [Pecten maximus]XP_033751728.1 DNA damage-regulated autophagy modulator protein 1-like isoform X1 [Pecten maximus]
MCLTLYQLLGKVLWILPIFTFSWIFSTVLLTYGLAVAQNHTYAVFPYISKTGTQVPERGIFTLFISIGALSMAMNAEMRFKYVELMYERMSLTPREKTRLSTMNKSALYLSLAAAFGLLIVASFQVDTMPIPHYSGAFLTFLLGGICCWLHAIITWKMYKEERDKAFFLTFIFQIIVSLFVSVFFVMFSVSLGHYRHQRDAGYGTKEFDHPEGALRPIFLTAAFSEWFLALTVVAYILTFVPGFRTIDYDGGTVKWKAPVSSSVSTCTKMMRCCS